MPDVNKHRIADYRKHAEERAVKHAPVAWKLIDDDDDNKGRIEAIFSTFGVMDHDGDIILSSAFTPNQEVPMVHAHRWDHVIGKGSVRVEADQAVFDGQLFLDTFNGMEAYKTIKNMGNLQEYSFGFRVLDYDIKEDPEAPWGYVRVIKKLDLFEVSDVLKGASIGTRTLAIKNIIDGEPVENIITNYTVSTGPSTTSDSQQGKTFNDELDDALAAVEGFVDRAKSLADTRVKEGRSLSGSKRSQLAGFADDLEAQAKRLRELSATEKADDDSGDSNRRVSPEVLAILRQRQQRMGLIPAD